MTAAATEARTLEPPGSPTQPCKAAALLAVKLGAFYEHKEAPAVLEALLKVAGAA
jgi:hypothetical protein